MNVLRIVFPLNIRIAGITQDSIVDGPGLRLTVFTQGCPHHCPGCHNPQTHDPRGGDVVTVKSIIDMMDANPLLTGITLSGGEPFMQPEACIRLANAAHARGLTVWTYTGFTLEKLMAEVKNRSIRRLLNATDVLVDGPFIEAQKSLDLKWRGSRNQRIINMNAIRNGKGIEDSVLYT